jgi:PAS domain-containing protein
VGSLTASKSEGQHSEACAVAGIKMTSTRQAESLISLEASENAEGDPLAARAALSLLRGAVEAVPEGLALFDADDRYVFWNEKYADIYGEGPDHDFRGLRFEDMAQALRARGRFRDALSCAESWIQGPLRANDAETKTCREFTLEGRGHSIQWLCPF